MLNGHSFHFVVQSAVPVVPNAEVVRTGSIARGSFGEVYKGEWRGMDIAVKHIDKKGTKYTQMLNEAIIIRYAHRHDSGTASLKI
jgi:predicted Ser/Thr protein kinase